MHYSQLITVNLIAVPICLQIVQYKRYYIRTINKRYRANYIFQFSFLLSNDLESRTKYRTEINAIFVLQ